MTKYKASDTISLRNYKHTNITFREEIKLKTPSEMLKKFIDSMNNASRCIVCVEHIGYDDTEYNTFDINGVWEDDGGVKVSLNDGNTEIYMRNWTQFSVFLIDDCDNCEEVGNDDIDGVYDGQDIKYMFKFVFGDIERTFISL